ncbi:MAG: glutamine synthetase III [Candidatus Obscuribacter phosphatis]|uniref:Glutamine synthetase III n=1 Tax=Candidatus Obscuribacter phosphatis TaxID=1906157 RepID=A0A8J7PHH4_9BACT|nr:glutamine synthetase III [Candidatus Obscuribacter phosphatis]
MTVKDRGMVMKRGVNADRGANLRADALKAVQSRTPVHTGIDYTETSVSDIFAQNVFNRATMRAVLPKNVYKAVIRCLDHGEQLDASMADIVANAMKDWAISRGATHFTHWFQPMTGLTAEKHDAFLVFSGEEGQPNLEFSGKLLIQGEPDASSFPSGGIRSTFEARGYTGWDPTSPAFLMESVNGKTLCIPTVFCSYSGHALDKKTPLLRSMEAISKQAVRLLNLLGNDSKRVTCTVGAEQEYFLIDDAYYLARPDIINSGRALFGARPPKGQEMEDHYWGSIKERVLAFMMDTEAELYKLGVPVKTRHNEVAPAQFEVAPVFETSNLATDHNMLLMEVFRNTARKHGLRCLFHEKPFSGVNGSGKHNNWSMADERGNNLLDPGHTPQDNQQFVTVLTAVIRAVNKYGHLLRASIAFAGNDHRLGANEAPPAIMSIYLGDKLTQVVEALISGKKEISVQSGTLQFGVTSLPELPRDDSDRNRTSPFAFTGNKFEFRAVGSSQSIAWPNAVLNTIVAESLDYVASEIEKLVKSGTDLGVAVEKVVRETLSENKRILFNGDNYSREWHEEAERRGLPNLKTTPEALPCLVDKETLALFKKYEVLENEELVSRYHINLEAYCKTVNIESLLTANMARTMILPAALDYQQKVAQTIATTRAAVNGVNLSTQEHLLKELCEKICSLQSAIDKLESMVKEAHHEESGDHEAENLNRARFFEQKVIPAMNAVRAFADELELIVDDSLWPLPKFREMLYVY